MAAAQTSRTAGLPQAPIHSGDLPRPYATTILYGTRWLAAGEILAYSQRYRSAPISPAADQVASGARVSSISVIPPLRLRLECPAACWSGAGCEFLLHIFTSSTSHHGLPPQRLAQYLDIGPSGKWILEVDGSIDHVADSETSQTSRVWLGFSHSEVPENTKESSGFPISLRWFPAEFCTDQTATLPVLEVSDQLTSLQIPRSSPLAYKARGANGEGHPSDPLGS
ncbi:hypothetical protein C8R45DRAFT_944300 [Mycena sanguinolenta]|nr:hypothetical protein C8R45DRAFT_944300 [Mycena sanguinolenta]